MNAKDLMLPALRQHRHNYGSEEFIAAYDYDEANKIVERLFAENEALKSKLAKGIRVTAINHPSGLVGFMEDAPTFDDKDRTNALLITDEVE